MINARSFKTLARKSGGLLVSIALLTGCGEQAPSEVKQLQSGIRYLQASDSVSFRFDSEGWKGANPTYTEYRYGKYISMGADGGLHFFSITSDKELHTFDFGTNKHLYSEPICRGEIDAWSIDSSFIYVLSNNIVYTKDYQLRTVDSFTYDAPAIPSKHGIDFSIENNSNLFRIKDYFVLMYYVVGDDTEYRNSKYLFYYFNKDRAFFADKMCAELDTSFQYFRYPAVASDGNFLYHAPRTLNCISKSTDKKTVRHVRIDAGENRYLPLRPEDQYEISKLKKYRFTTHYNRDIICSGNSVYLLKEFQRKTWYEKGVQQYKHGLELIRFDKQLKRIGSVFIQDNNYDYALISDQKLYLFNLQKNKYYVYEI